jgi:hypothetical protein
MATIYVYADESGDLVFRRPPSGSRYYLVTTVTLQDCSVGDALLQLRRELALAGQPAPDSYFHASHDRLVVRQQVFGLLGQHSFRVDATVLDKPKTQPHLSTAPQRFVKQAWYMHFKYVLAQAASPTDQLLVVVAAQGTRGERRAFARALWDVGSQVAGGCRTAFWPAAADPCLQVADYCSWAIHRKWEQKDATYYNMIRGKLRSEFDVFGRSSLTYY